ncbi:cell wall hydrolase [Stakelama sp. CBK3Z-3]|uniref:Cell wall hydrolase n=1 Tax=Stakelama flava TaxID=2860338 RepID=A0ABS6XKJ4_9SPHN|nr:cell wall hydrolase [Stakelama flava]MBW4330734.1 cell wall hydrolase [Stakelama flava]
MKFSLRTAITAVVTICAATTAGFSAPGFALELPGSVNVIDQTSLSAINARNEAKVPTPPPPIVPIALTPDEQPADAAVGGDDDGDADFASLSDAVAAQSVPSNLDKELRCLATGVYFESKGESLAGQLAVADVILNRAQSQRFPDSVCSVLTQRSQFSFVRGGRLPKPRVNSRAWRTAVAVAKIASADLWDSPVPDALFFHARYVSPSWRLAKVGAVGNHVFYR